MASNPRIEHSWQATEDEIMRLCAYISDDSAVAAYHGTTVERVQKVRAKMTKRSLKLVSDTKPKSEEAVNASTLKTEERALEASAQLLERCNMLFRKFAKQHCMGVDDALVVQQFGWNIWHRLKAPMA